MANEIHIASMIVHVQPSNLATLLNVIEAHPAVETRAHSPQGKVVIVAEGAVQREVLNVIDELEQLEGVLSCTMVYHEVIQQADADELLTVRNAIHLPADSTQILPIQTEMTS